MVSLGAAPTFRLLVLLFFSLTLRSVLASGCSPRLEGKPAIRLHALAVNFTHTYELCTPAGGCVHRSTDAVTAAETAHSAYSSISRGTALA